MNGALIDIFGVIPSARVDALLRDNTGAPVYAIPYKDISCVVRDSRSGAVLDRENALSSLLSYQLVMENLIAEYTVVPIKFGVKLASRSDVLNMLENGYEEFSRRLKVFNGKIEADVSAFWNDMDKVIKEVASENGAIRSLRDEISEKPVEETSAERIRLGALIKDALDKRRVELTKKVIEALGAHALDLRIHDVVDDREVLNCALLLERANEGNLHAELNKLNDALTGEIAFKFISPQPLYSFTTFDVRKIAYSELEHAAEVLGIQTGSDFAEIKESYLSKVLERHPDSDPGNLALEKRFEEITWAYETIRKCCGDDRLPAPSESGNIFYAELVKR